MSLKRRRSFTADFKLKVIQKAEKDGNREAGRCFEVDESAVRHWRKDKETLKNMGQKRSNRRGKVQWPALEDALHSWVLEQRNVGHSVSTFKIHLQAKAMAEEMKFSNFKGGPSWVYRFMRRKNLRVHTKTTIKTEIGIKSEELKREETTDCDIKICNIKSEPSDTIPQYILELFNSDSENSDFEGFT